MRTCGANYLVCNFIFFLSRGDGPYAVASRTSRRFHSVVEGPFTACGKLKCGTLDFPGPMMIVMEIAGVKDDTMLCKFCVELSHL